MLLLAFLFLTIASVDGRANQTLAEIVSGSKEFSSFNAWLNKADAGYSDVVALLKDTTKNLTLFAPSNEAFNTSFRPVPPEQTLAMLQYCIVEGMAIEVGELKELQFYKTLLGNINGTLMVAREGRENIKIIFGVPGDGNTTARVATTATQAANGVLYTIDTILVPPEDVAATFKKANLTGVVNALKVTGLSNTVENLPSSTIFAPVNRAFKEKGFSNMLMDGLETTIQNHVLHARKVSTSLKHGDNFTTLSGDILKITVIDGEVFVNGATVLIPNILTSHGVIHVVEKVLTVPASEKRNVVENLALNPTMTTLSQLLTHDEFADAKTWLEQTSKYTLFAPNDEAFEKAKNTTVTVDQGMYHVVTSVIDIKPTDNVSIVTTLLDDAAVVKLDGAAQVLEIAPGPDKVMINKLAQVAELNLPASNGAVVQIIDSVLAIPEDSVATMKREGLNTLSAGVKRAGLVDYLTSTSSLTIFAPNDAGFAALLETLTGNSSNVTTMDTKKITDLLQTHVVAGASYSTDLKNGSTLKGLNNKMYNVSIDKDGTIKLNESTVLKANIETESGVIHILDSVIGGPIPGQKKSGLSGGAVAAIVVGILVILGGGVYCYQQSESEHDGYGNFDD